MTALSILEPSIIIHNLSVPTSECYVRVNMNTFLFYIYKQRNICNIILLIITLVIKYIYTSNIHQDQVAVIDVQVSAQLLSTPFSTTEYSLLTTKLGRLRRAGFMWIAWRQWCVVFEHPTLYYTYLTRALVMHKNNRFILECIDHWQQLF